MYKPYQLLGRIGGLVTAMALLLPYFNATASLPTARPNSRMLDVEYSMLDVASGLLTAVTNALGEVTRNAYDPQGRLTATWGNTYPVAYEYDHSGRMTAMATTRDNEIDFATLAVQLANGASLTSIGSTWSLDLTQWQYHEPTGLLTNKLYADGKGTSYTYTPDGKLASRTWSRGITTTYSYDTAQNLSSISYWRNSVSAIPDPDTPSVSFTHDRLGRQISAVVDGVSTNLYSYDALTLALTNEISCGQSSVSALTRTYDHLGRPAGLSLGPDYAIEYAYDEYGRFNNVSSSASLASLAVQYSYLPGTDLLSGYTAGNFTRTVSYEPYRSLITSVANTFGSTTISQYDYTNDQLGRRTAISRSGTAFGDTPVRDAYGYNHRSEVTSARRTLAGNPTQEVRGFSYDYAYDPIGNRISSTEYDPDNTPLVSAYTANALNQYENRTIPGYAAVRGSATNTATVTVNGNPAWRLDDYFYGGDEADNSTTAIMKELQIIAAHSNHYAAATGHVFVAQTPEQYQYDDDGNLTQDGRWQYTWNGENRLIKAKTRDDLPESVPRVTVEYAYDHQGRMVWKSVAPTTGHPLKTIQYLWDDYNIIAEVESRESGVTTTYNIWGLDLSGSIQGAGGVGGLLAVYSPLPLGEEQGEDGIALPCYDANGNITEYLSDSGTITAHYEYSPFGEIVVQSGDLASTFTHRFSTKPWCAITGLSEYEYRKYSPEMGRWFSRDPIGESESANLLAVTLNDQLTRVDYLGLMMSPIRKPIEPERVKNEAVVVCNTDCTPLILGCDKWPKILQSSCVIHEQEHIRQKKRANPEWCTMKKTTLTLPSGESFECDFCADQGDILKDLTEVVIQWECEAHVRSIDAMSALLKGELTEPDRSTVKRRIKEECILMEKRYSCPKGSIPPICKSAKGW